MPAELTLEVQALESAATSSAFVFEPAHLMVRIGLPNNDLQTCDIYFELKDDGSFDTTKYTGFTRVFKGNMNIPLSIVSQLENPDGSYNEAVINELLSSANLKLKSNAPNP